MIAGERKHCEAAAPPAPSRVGPREGRAAARAMLVGLLIGVSVVIAAALYTMPQEFMSLHGLAFIGVALGEIALTVAWAAMTRRHWLLRLAAAVGVTVGFAALLPGHSYVSFAGFLGFLLLYSLHLAAWLVTLRLLGLRFQADDERDPSRNADGTWRYSLAGLFAVTTAAAVLAALVRAAGLPDGSWWILLGYHTAFVLVSLLGLAPMLVRGHPARWGVLTLLSFVAAPLLGSLAEAMEQPYGMTAWLTLCQACYLLAAGWVLRAAGYRAAWSDSQ